MKKIVVYIFVVSLVLLGGCILPVHTTTPKTTDENNTLEKYLYINLPQLQKENQRLYYLQWGKLSESTFDDCVFILSDTQYTDVIQSDYYMVAYVGGNYLIQELGTFDNMVVQNGNLYLADMDGDGVDEIIIHFEVSGNGATITRIYKAADNSIVNVANLDDFDIGFVSEFENGYKLKISNEFTGYVQDIDIKQWFSADYFDATGKSISQDEIFLRPFSTCNAKDTDEDGIFELFCSQEVILEGYIGEALVVLKYDLQTAGFKVIDAVFEVQK